MTNLCTPSTAFQHHVSQNGGGNDQHDRADERHDDVEYLLIGYSLLHVVLHDQIVWRTYADTAEGGRRELHLGLGRSGVVVSGQTQTVPRGGLQIPYDQVFRSATGYQNPWFGADTSTVLHRVILNRATAVWPGQEVQLNGGPIGGDYVPFFWQQRSCEENLE